MRQGRRCRTRSPVEDGAKKSTGVTCCKNRHTAIDGIGRLGTLFTRCVERWLDPEDLTLVQCRGNPQPFDVQQIGGHQLGNLILFGDDTEKALPPLCAIDTEPYSEHEPAAGNRFDKIGMAPLNFC